ncbi:MAG: right-handed parallel beta-helix repeat-containing protein [Polyangiales bacterium]
MAGEGGAGGTPAGCTLTGNWETIGSWGSDTLGYGNVAVLQNPSDDSVWQVVSRTDSVDVDEIALFQSGDGGASWLEVDAWSFPSGRRGWTSGADIAADGTIFVVLRESSDDNTDRDATLLRYSPGGTLTEVGSFLPPGSNDTRPNTLAVRGGEAWFIAYDVTQVPPDYHIVRYANDALASFDVIEYGDNVFVRDLGVAPNGKIWAVGQGHDEATNTWRATIWEEGEAEFALLAEIERTPGVDESDTIMALAFDDAGRYWTSYYTIENQHYRWRSGSGMVDAPQASFAWNDDFGLDASKASLSTRVAIHPSGAVFTGGNSVDALDWQWGIVRRGTTAGFSLSDKFIHGRDGVYVSNVSSILVDKQKNVWAAYMSRPGIWFPKLTTLRKMACLDTEPPDPSCIGSGNQDDINEVLNKPGSIAVLCQGAEFDLTSPVVFTDDGQEVYTEGRPTDERRAKLRVASDSLVTAVDMLGRSNVVLSHVIVDGSRPAFGYRTSGALIQAGGSVSGQVVRSVKAFEPRHWSILHLFEGGEPQCTGATVEDNELGPAGQPDGTWADGISLACKDSVVRSNTIVDATDGAIVIFAAPGSIIENNTIVAETRTLLGGINLVDYGVYGGNYSNTRVRGNVIDAAGAVIRIGMGMGWRVWVCFDPASSEDPSIYGGSVTGNTLMGDQMQYGFAVDGVRDWTVTGNIDLATHSGTPTIDCNGELASPPAGFQFHSARAQGTFQPEFIEAFLELALWAVDGPP